MNQHLKECVYNKGTMKQVNFIADVGGMNDEERQVFTHIHNGKTDVYIQDVMCLNRKAYERIEESVRSKMSIAVFECINFYMNHNKN